MKFKLAITAVPGHDFSKLEVLFEAPTWDAAAKWADKFQAQIGATTEGHSTVVTYAPKEV